jgi:hypothetical protein
MLAIYDKHKSGNFSSIVTLTADYIIPGPADVLFLYAINFASGANNILVFQLLCVEFGDKISQQSWRKLQ